MKNIIFILCLLTLSFTSYAQKTYTINNETIELKTEVDGSLGLLWNTFDGNYRYFIKTNDNAITELKNTKGSNNKYQNEYRTTLESLTNNKDTSKTDLTLYSLKRYINEHNKSIDSSYNYDENKAKIGMRLGVFGGLTNQPFVENPENTSVGFFGVELELYDESKTFNHAGFINLRHTLDNDDFLYSSTQIALGYRYRFIETPKVNVYGQVKFATFTSSKTTITIEDTNNPGTFITQEETGSAFDAPLIFGLGADIKVGNSGYITLIYDSLFAVLLDNQENFPMDFGIGYKFKL